MIGDNKTNMRTTTTNLKILKAKGKIRGFKDKPKRKPNPATLVKSQAKIWLTWNLQDFAKENGLALETEYRFDSKRLYRFDFCFPDDNVRVAVEFEGGIFMRRSGHNTAKHYTKDCIKYNLGLINGWKVLRYTALNYKDAVRDLKLLIQNI